MTNLFNRWLPCVTLAAWSAILLSFAQPPAWLGGNFLAAHTFLFSGRVEAFLVPAFRPYVLLAGLALFVMALAFACFPADAACCSASECGHPLSRFAGGKWLTFLVLLVPVGAAAFMAPDTFGKSTMLNRGIITDASALGGKSRLPSLAPPDLPLPTNDAFPGTGSPAPAATASDTKDSNDYLRRTPEGYIETEVLDMLWAVQEPGMRALYENKTVQLIGQLMPDGTTHPGVTRFKAVRMMMTCCAADARPVASIIEAATAPEIPEMTWVKIVGKATFPIENGRRTMVLQAQSVAKTEPPSETMLY